MNSLTKLVRDFFGFSRAHANGFVGLIILTGLVLFSNPVYKAWFSQQPDDFSQEKKFIDSLLALEQAQPMELIDTTSVNQSASVFFEFDPNQATTVELQRLGFSEKLTKRLVNYRIKGGEFRVKSDLKKLYGMDSLFYDRLYPYIQLPDKIVFEKKIAAPNPKPVFIAFDLNMADTIQLMGIRGIGPVLAKRIIKYREALGGFVSNAQLTEVYGLDSAVVKKMESVTFLAESFGPRKLNINQLGERELSLHPYFSKKIAKAIVAYRFQHGNYRSVDDLRKIETLDQKTLEKVYPYLTVE